MVDCEITDEYRRNGIDIIQMENELLRVEVLAGKGGDITEIRDKRTNINILFEAPHNWRVPSEGTIGAPDAQFSFLDHYPGGWQDVLPGAGGPAKAHGAPLGLHGESSLVPWDARVIDDRAERVAVRLETTLTRYPLEITREVGLEAGRSSLRVEESVSNVGEVEVDYSWLQHISLGEPLIAPSATLDVPCETILVDPGHDVPQARLPAGESFDWPVCETGGDAIDLREFPPKDERVHDMVALADLSDGRYTVANSDLDLGVTVTFPEDVFEYLWYWQPLGGFVDAPFYGRNYNVGLEPSTSIPNAGLEDAIENGTAKTLAPGATESATITCKTHNTE